MAAFDESLPRLGASTMNPAKQMVDSNPNKEGKKQKNELDIGEKF